jgi:hypothetical protein
MIKSDDLDKAVNYAVTDQSFKILSPGSLKRALGPSAEHNFLPASDSSTMVTSFKVLDNEI